MELQPSPDCAQTYEIIVHRQYGNKENRIEKNKTNDLCTDSMEKTGTTNEKSQLRK